MNRPAEESQGDQTSGGPKNIRPAWRTKDLKYADFPLEVLRVYESTVLIKC